MAATGQEAVALEQLRTLNVAISGKIDKKIDAPSASGTAGQVLSTNGTATEWMTLPEGTAYTGTAPITVSGSAIGISAATTGAAGSMSAADKAKLDGIDANANNYTLPAATASTIGGVKPGTGCEVTADGTMNVTVSGGTEYQGTAPIVVAGNAISITAASTSAAGSMSAADKSKLDGIAANANNYVLPAASGTVLGGVKLAGGFDVGKPFVHVAQSGAGTPVVMLTESFENYNDDNIIGLVPASSTVLGGVKFASDTDFNAYMGIS